MVSACANLLSLEPIRRIFFTGLSRISCQEYLWLKAGPSCIIFILETNKLCIFSGFSSKPNNIPVWPGGVKNWIDKYRTVVVYSASTASEFEQKYGELALTLVAQNDTAYKLTKALRAQQLPVYITDGVAKQWLSKYRGMRHILFPAQVLFFFKYL